MSLRAISFHSMESQLSHPLILILLAGRFDSFTSYIQIDVCYMSCRFETWTPEIEKWKLRTNDSRMLEYEWMRKKKCSLTEAMCNEYVPFFVRYRILIDHVHCFSRLHIQLFFFVRDSITCLFYTIPISNIDLTTADWYVIHHRFVYVCKYRWMFRLWKCTNKLPMRSLTI